MGNDTTIEWTDATWNPVRGCSRVSPGCENCYAERVAARFSDPGQAYHGLAKRTPHGPAWTRKVRLVPEHLADPLRWQKPRRVFVNSMSDLFHEALSNEEIAAVFGVMAAAPQHTFQVLTKRAARMRQWFRWNANAALDRIACCADEALEDLEPKDWLARWFAPGRGAQVWPLPNVWLGVSVEDQARADERIPELLQTPAAVRFLSCEPLLGPVDLETYLGELPEDEDGAPYAGRIDWVIVGGESGPGAREFRLEWARSIVDQCRAARVACFVKQLGAAPSTCTTGCNTRPHPAEPFHTKDRKGGDWSEWPADLRVREFPKEAP